MDNSISSSEKKTKKLSVIRLLGTIVSSGMLVYLMAREWQDILTAVRQLELSTLVAISLLTIFSRVCILLRWHILLRSAGAAISINQSARLFLAGLFSSNFLPTTIGGDLVRFAGLVRFKITPTISAGSLVMDRLVGMAGMVSLLPVGLVQFFSVPLPNVHTDSLPNSELEAVSIVGILGYIREKTRKVLDSVWHSVGLWTSHPSSFLFSFIFTCVHMLCLIMTLWILFSSLHDPVAYWVIGGLWSMSYFFTLLPFSINGLGLQELSLTFLFVNYAGAELNNVVVVALAIRVLQTLVSLPGAFCLPGLIQPNKKETNGQERNGF
jgi:hypothetical protein